VPGMYGIQQKDGGLLLLLAKDCIHLNQEGCKHPRKPEACKKYQFGGIECNKLRKEFKLPPIDHDDNIKKQRISFLINFRLKK
jgi:hypothetical protein